MDIKILRKYGVAATINFTLRDVDDVKDFLTTAVHASGDTIIMKNEGAEVNTTNGFVDEGIGYSIVLSTIEMQSARNVLYIIDQGTKLWRDEAIIVETYGHASAQHAFDLDSDLSGNNVDWKFNSIDIQNSTGIGLNIAGGGANEGVKISGGVTGNGLEIVGGSTSGKGINISTTDGHGIDIAVAGASKAGIRIDSNAAEGIGITSVGEGIKIVSSFSHGISLTAASTGLYIRSTSGAGIDLSSAGAPGLSISTTGTNMNGASISGNGSAAGLRIIGGATGNGLELDGGSTSGDGLEIRVTSGKGIDIVATGQGIYVESTTTHALQISASGGSGTGIQCTSNAGEGAFFGAGGDNSGIKAAGSGSGHGLYLVAGA
ncbi:MAG: hypothetical protein KAR44_15125, partial [Candidatus Aegiribacteria sp.]|nr:hypothetical protein [Candidatus Aegiribacteria sp.]